jgi:hypothetical protein
MASIRKMRPLPVFATRSGRREGIVEVVGAGLSDDTAEDLVRGDNNQF